MLHERARVLEQLQGEQRKVAEEYAAIHEREQSLVTGEEQSLVRAAHYEHMTHLLNGRPRLVCVLHATREKESAFSAVNFHRFERAEAKSGMRTPYDVDTLISNLFDLSQSLSLPEYVAQHLHPYYMSVLRPRNLSHLLMKEERSKNPRLAELVETLKYVPFADERDSREAIFVFCGKRIDCFWKAMHDFYFNFSQLVLGLGGSMRFKAQSVSVSTATSEEETAVGEGFDLAGPE